MAGLGRYPAEVAGIADELGSLLRGSMEEAALAVLDEVGEVRLFAMLPEERTTAEALLTKTPLQRERALARLSERAAAVLIMRARYLGLISAAAFRLAERLEYVPGMSYRAAAARGLREATEIRMMPRIEDVLPAARWRRDRPAGRPERNEGLDPDPVAPGRRR
jgi:hypothetical protein